MSTELKSIKGRIEFVKDVAKREVGYEETELHLTRFAGGKENGVMLQMSLESNQSNLFTHIQLTKEQVKELISTLTEAFELNSIQDKINQLHKLTNKLPFIEYYSHSKCDEYKILNEYTNYLEDKLVLCPVTDGFEKALDLAIEGISRYKKEFTNC